MKIVIKKDDGTIVFDGILSYVEGGTHKGNTSFHYQLRNPKGEELEIYFSPKDKQEAEEFIEQQQDVINTKID